MKKLKILCITPPNPHLKTPETGFAEELARRGHDVSIVFSMEKLPKDVIGQKFDIVFGMMENSIGLANCAGKLLNAPVYNHLEWVPPWRVGQEPLEKWGYEESTVEKIGKKELEYYNNVYKYQVSEWEKSTIRSCAGKCLIKTIEPFATKPIDCKIRYYAPDTKKLERYRDNTIKEENKICTIARFVPHKRVVHIIRALALIPKEKRPVYTIVGYGQEVYNIINEATKLGVNIELVGSGLDGVKEKVIQESMFLVTIWAGIPLAEGFYYKKPGISYKEDHIYEVFKDSLLYAEPNNIEDLAKKIEYFIDHPEERKRYGERGYELMMNNKIGMTTPEYLAKQIENILYEGIEVFYK